jgi:DNA-binding Xre family transcriptional regulator
MPTRKFQELLDKMPAESRREVALRVKKTLEAMPLDELRRARQMTQTKLAESWGVTQSEVSKIEHRTDAYISTLAEYIEALGGRLEIRAIFPDREMRISQFEEIPK